MVYGRWMRWIVLLIAACGGATVTAPTEKEAAIERREVEAAADGRDGVHGMVIFGERQVYVSHLPMFHAPHDVQLVARVRIEGRVLTGLHTIAPERFRLDEVLRGERRGFSAELYRGNFEAGGEPLGTVAVTIEELVVARPLDGGGEDEWYVIGGGDEWWAVHRIGAAPSFDAIARVGFERAPTAGRYRGTLAVGGEVGATITSVAQVSCLIGPTFTDSCVRN